MKTSLIFTTCALSEDPEISNKKGTRGMGKPYFTRVSGLRKMLSIYRSVFDEVIVAGEWEEGEGYTYIFDPGKLRDPCDHAQQRHTATLASTGDVIVYLNDDTYLPPEHVPPTLEAVSRYGAVGFSHYTVTDEGPVWLCGALNESHPYIPGHASAFKREVIEKVPWSLVEGKDRVDVLHSNALRDAGFDFNFRTYIPVYDIEKGEWP